MSKRDLGVLVVIKHKLSRVTTRNICNKIYLEDAIKLLTILMEEIGDGK